MYRGKQYLCSMASVMTPVRMARMLRPRPDDAHKGTMGHALLVAGSAGVGGCAVLAAESCLRAGVGKLTVCTPECNRLLVQVSVPEAVLRTLPHLGVNAPSPVARDYSQWQAVGIGPGIGPDAGALLHSDVDEIEIGNLRASSPGAGCRCPACPGCLPGVGGAVARARRAHSPWRRDACAGPRAAGL